MLPHIGAAWNLARYLMRNDADAKDVLQEAILRAFKSFDRYEDRNTLAWVLMIVRNVGYDALKKNKLVADAVAFDELLHSGHTSCGTDAFPQPDLAVGRLREASRVREAISRLPLEYREVIVLRELEDLSYHEIAIVLGIPEGTVMSRLSRGRESLRLLLGEICQKQESGYAL